MDAEFAVDRLEPWHAVFRGSSDCVADVLESARKYGAHCMSAGLASDFKIIGLNIDDEAHIHCIPYDGPIDIFNYWKRIVDNNDRL